jgi:hypothetical protein
MRKRIDVVLQLACLLLVAVAGWQTWKDLRNGFEWTSILTGASLALLICAAVALVVCRLPKRWQGEVTTRGRVISLIVGVLALGAAYMTWSMGANAGWVLTNAAPEADWRAWAMFLLLSAITLGFASATVGLACLSTRVWRSGALRSTPPSNGS